MPKNILIFSDGTGQAGGLLLDEKRTNVYKLYRATRCGPETANDPLLQVAFYDPGLGSQTAPGGRPITLWRQIYNLVSQATGLGITRNIIDCYAAIIELWRPGDRIYLFGFSRGAYTVRCLGGVLSLCGVPRSENGVPIKVDHASAERIASEAVKKVYQHGASKKEPRFRAQRAELAAKFRARYGSDAGGVSNEVPYFIGVWDTVAALGASWSKMLLAAIIGIPLILLVLYGLAWGLAHWAGSLQGWYRALILLVFGGGLIAYLWTHVKWATGISYPLWQTFHIVAWQLKFYDRNLNDRVQFARHALSIDERRKDFRRVEWTNSTGLATKGEHAVNWFEQVWFAGNHADVGGGYIENESRLSDISLAWIVNEARRVPYPISIDPSYLRPTPFAGGMQHDETQNAIFGIEWLRWPVKPREVPDGAYLYPSVFERLALAEVLNFGTYEKYDPEPLRGRKFNHYQPHPAPSPQAMPHTPDAKDDQA